MTGRPRNPEREAARRSGARFYRDARPCHAGHAGDRYTSTGACVACMSQRIRWPVKPAAQEELTQ